MFPNDQVIPIPTEDLRYVNTVYELLNSNWIIIVKAMLNLAFITELYFNAYNYKALSPPIRKQKSQVTNMCKHKRSSSKNEVLLGYTIYQYSQTQNLYL